MNIMNPLMRLFYFYWFIYTLRKWWVPGHKASEPKYWYFNPGLTDSKVSGIVGHPDSSICTILLEGSVAPWSKVSKVILTLWFNNSTSGNLS